MQHCDRQGAETRGLGRLRIHRVLALCAEADDIAGIGETHDLAAAVGQDLVESNRTGLDAKDMRGGVALGKYELLGFDSAQRGSCARVCSNSPIGWAVTAD
jgi:hypothetical protein